MNLQQLRYILEIADCRSITKASKKLFISQPYLSKVISDFEARQKNQIFFRYNNGVELTSYGQKVYLIAQSIINQIDMLDNLEKEKTIENDCVKLSFSVGHFILKDSLLSDYFSTTHAARNDVEFHETTIEECIANVEENISEFAILVVNDFQKTLLTSMSLRKGIECIKLDEGYMYYHLYRNHPLINQDEISMESLTQYPLVRFKTDKYAIFSNGKFKEEYPDVYVRRCIEVNHYHSCLSMVKHNGAFMIGNKWQISELEKMGIQSIRVSSIKHKVYLLIVKKEMQTLSTEAKRFFDLFKDSYGLDWV